MKIIYLIITLVLSVTCSEPTKGEQTGKVIAVADGDTFTILYNNRQQEKIRLHGIDCPERGQDYGAVAKQKISELVFSRTLRIEEKTKDRYGRSVAIAYDEKNRCINEEMLKSGMAWHYKEYDDNARWSELEMAARKARLGLWAQPYPTAPWAWRKAKRKQEALDR